MVHIPGRPRFTKDMCLCAPASKAELVPLVIAACLAGTTLKVWEAGGIMMCGAEVEEQVDARELGVQIVPKRNVLSGRWRLKSFSVRNSCWVD